MDDISEKVRREAADWFARMRGEGSATYEQDLAVWRAASSENDDAYQRLELQWDRSRFGASLDTVRNRDLTRVNAWHQRPVARIAVAASLALILLLGIATIIHRPIGSAVMAYRSAPGELRTLTLADGTHIVLDADSAVRVDVTAKARRIELLRGRARVEVAAGAAVPFVAAAAEATVTTFASTFDLELAPHGTRLAVQRGTAEVRGSADAGRQAAAFWRLGPGQRLVIAAGSAPGAAAADAFQWPNGMLSFDGERLDDAVALLNRYNRQHIRLADPVSGARRITGAFHARDPRGFAAAVAAMFGMSLSSDRDGTLVLVGK